MTYVRDIIIENNVSGYYRNVAKVLTALSHSLALNFNVKLRMDLKPTEKKEKEENEKHRSEGKDKESF